MSEQNPNKTIMGIPGINLGAKSEEDDSSEQSSPARQTMFGLPAGSLQAAASEVSEVDEDDDDGLPTQIVSADAFSFDSEPAAEEFNPRATALGGLPSLAGKGPGRPKVEEDESEEDEEDAAVPSFGGFAKAFDGEEDDKDSDVSLGRFVTERPRASATLMGMSLEDVLSQAGGDDDASARSTMFSMPAPSFDTNEEELVSEASEGEDDELPTQAIGVEQLEQYAEEESDELDNRKRLLAKLRSSRKQENKESETKGTMFGIPGINHERDEDGSRVPITGVLKMPKRKSSLPAPALDTSSLVSSTAKTTPEVAAPRFDIASLNKEPSEASDATAVVTDEFSKQISASFASPSEPSAPDFGSVDLSSPTPDRFGSQPAINLPDPEPSFGSQPAIHLPESEPFASEPSVQSEPISEAGVGDVDPFGDTQVAHLDDFQPPPGLEEEIFGQPAPADPAPSDVSDATEAPPRLDEPRASIPTPMFDQMEVERLPRREPEPEPAPTPEPIHTPAPAHAAPPAQAPPAHAHPAPHAHAASAQQAPVPEANPATTSNHGLSSMPSDASSSMIGGAPVEANTSGTIQRIVSGFAALPLIASGPLAFIAGEVSGVGFAIVGAPLFGGVVALALAALGVDVKLRSAGLVIVTLIAGAGIIGGLALGGSGAVVACVAAGALFALLGAVSPLLFGSKS